MRFVRVTQMNETESMINSLNPYLAYKSSGVPWLGDVPTHWEIRRLRTVADMRVSNGSCPIQHRSRSQDRNKHRAPSHTHGRPQYRCRPPHPPWAHHQRTRPPAIGVCGSLRQSFSPQKAGRAFWVYRFRLSSPVLETAACMQFLHCRIHPRRD